MNAIATNALVPATSDDDLVRILGNSLYPGARPESIRLVLAWCKATGRDPMKKPIHVVPMNVKDAVTGKYAWRDVLMPGIGTYRSDAAASGAYAGKDEPEFGPDVTRKIDQSEVSFPQWCKVTVYKIVGGERRAFTAKEFWMENYASGQGGNGVNAMWSKRPYGQLAKVAEAQALRMAFPVETGNTNTSEELEGKTVFEGQTIDAEPERKELRETRREQHRPIKTDVYEAQAEETAMEQTFIDRAEISLNAEPNGTKWLKVLDACLAQAATLDDIAGIRGVSSFNFTMENAPSLIKERIEDMMKAAAARVSAPEKPNEGPSFNGNGNGHELAGNGTNATKAEATTVQDEAKSVANALKAKPDNDDDGFPGDRP
jgi:phage recombination protein Bet